MAKNGNQSKQPILTNEKPKHRQALVAPKQKNKNPNIVLSFNHFAQQEYFGLEGQSTHWFVSLLERLKDITAKDTSLLENPMERDTYRLHLIDWKARNCPMKRGDMVWLPQEIRDNEDDFPLWQFQISTGTGRVIGYFDENVFHVVLLDPKHNMQPSKDYGYKVDKTTIAQSQYECLCKQVALSEKERASCKQAETCPVKDLQKRLLPDDVFFAAMDKDLVETYVELVDSGTLQQKLEDVLTEAYVLKK